MPLDSRKEKILQEAYYRDGLTFGRDALFDFLQKKYKKTHPTKEEVGEWLSRQKLQQLYLPTKKGGVTNSFQPTKPWASISIDLIDFINKPSKNYSYIFVLIDNFSRFMVCEPLTSKKAATAAKGFAKMLDKIKSQFGDPKISTCICDDGVEWKGDTMGVFKKYGIEKRRTLGGSPQQNGLVERANGKLKMLLSKMREIKGGGWSDNLKQCTENYNIQYNRGTKYQPAKAVLFTGADDQKALRGNVREAYKPAKNNNFSTARKFNVGDKVRVKLAKGKIDKASTPNWSSSLYTVSRVIPSRGTIAEKYSIKEKPDDLRYSRNDLQKIEGPIDDIPDYFKKKPVTRSEVAAKNELSIGAMTRSRSQPPKPPAPMALRRSAAPKAKPKSKAKAKATSELYQPESISGSREGKAGVEYNVKWVGYPASQNTWEPRDRLLEDLSEAEITYLINNA